MLDFCRMTKPNDFDWVKMQGGYRTPFDPRPLLAKLETEEDLESTWHSLWDELHHQGDVGEASFAAVPQLVRIYRHRDGLDWNPYAIVAIIELARKVGNNPDVPNWLQEEYFRSIRELAEIGARALFNANNPDLIRAILCVLAIERGLRTYARILVNYTEEEVATIAPEL